MLIYPMLSALPLPMVLAISANGGFGDVLWRGIQQMHTTEWIAAILSFWCVILAAKNSIWNWPVAMAGSLIYAWVFLVSGLYSDAILNVLFVGFQCYGWMRWRKNSVIGEALKPSVGPRKSIIRVMITALCIYPVWVYIVSSGLFGNLISSLVSGDIFMGISSVFGHSPLSNIAPPRFVYLDAMLLFLSLGALYMQAKKWVQNWILWIVVDLIYVPVYWLNHNYITSILYLIYIPIAVKGYQMWREESERFSPVERNIND
jgi:nicotinamide mononucleotide transporter